MHGDRWERYRHPLETSTILAALLARTRHHVLRARRLPKETTNGSSFPRVVCCPDTLLEARKVMGWFMYAFEGEEPCAQNHANHGLFRAL